MDIGPVNDAVAELLGRPDLVARLAEAPDIAVVIRPTLRQRDDVIRHRRWGDNSLRIAVST